MQYKKAKHLEGVNYEIRGKVAEASRKLRMQGIDILELNIGNPGAFNFKVPDTMNQAIVQNLDKAAPYCDSKGIYSAREAIVAETQNQGIKGVTTDEVLIGNGVSELIMMSMEALLNPGDEVLVPSPDYPLWTAAVTIANGKAVHYPCKNGESWEPDVSKMEALITEKTRALVVINPNNPTGAVYSKKTLMEITDLARRRGLVILADEIYNKVLYDGAQAIPIGSLSSDVLVCTYNGLSKNYRACGYRAGWLILSGPIDEAESFIDGLGLMASMRLCANVPAQWAIQTALGGHQSIFELCNTGGRLLEQRNQVVEGINAIDGVKCARPEGGMYVFAEIDFERYPFKSDQEFVLRFLNETHTLVVQGSGFNYTETPAFRLAFLPAKEQLALALERLQSFLTAATGKA